MSGAGTQDLARDRRAALELPASENAELCSGCTRCCETVSIEVEAPGTPREYDQLVWVLHHRGLELYIERPGRWMLHIETRCEKLNEHGRCGIHGKHPVLCREYDPRTCERRAPLTEVAAWFHDAAELEAWLRNSRPVHWKRLEAWRAKMAAVPASGNGHGAVLAHVLVQIGEAASVAHEPAVRARERKAARGRR